MPEKTSGEEWMKDDGYPLSKRPGGDTAKALPKVVTNTMSNSCRLSPKLLTSGELVVPSPQQSIHGLSSVQRLQALPIFKMPTNRIACDRLSPGLTRSTATGSTQGRQRFREA